MSSRISAVATRFVTLAAGALALAAGTALCAAEPSLTVARWQAELARVDGLLRAGSWEEARAASGGLVAELLSDLKGGPAGAGLLAAAYAQRALAEAGVGEREEALWSLGIAGCLEPAFAATPLDGFGEAGERLGSWRRAEPDARAGAVRSDTPGLVPPALLESPTIVFRASAEVLRAFDLTLAVEVVVDAEGRPRAPSVQGSLDNPSPVAASLEVLRRWRFEPARLDGRAVPLVVILELPLTQGAADRARGMLGALHAVSEP
jgi:hypothetical protein